MYSPSSTIGPIATSVTVRGCSYFFFFLFLYSPSSTIGPTATSVTVRGCSYIFFFSFSFLVLSFFNYRAYCYFSDSKGLLLFLFFSFSFLVLSFFNYRTYCYFSDSKGLLLETSIEKGATSLRSGGLGFRFSLLQ